MQCWFFYWSPEPLFCSETCKCHWMFMNVLSIYIYNKYSHICTLYCIPRKSQSTKLCPLVGSGILNSWIILKTILCLVLDFQGIYIYIHTLDILYDSCIFVYILYYALFNTIIFSSLFQSHHLISHPKQFTTATTLPLAQPYRANRWGNPLPRSLVVKTTGSKTMAKMKDCWFLGKKD